ncbi:hypothetical protein BDN70DRAFT_946993 [Pholiota conissans]|uniref:Uncharacterized protein n=1 Tax=Pholiota conissans TaxID=109636 RepID=A0A9P5ZDR5_9AGAR|nr:hypothetical protein BDN70DRAFT_946993 [Pholiota conissans]
MLQCLALYDQDRDPFPPTIPAVYVFANLPQLCEVILSGYSVVDVVLPWAQLESFMGSKLTTADCLDVLEKCPRLRHCTFENVDEYGEDVVELTHPSLETFELYIDDIGELRDLLSKLKFPTLHSFLLQLNFSAPLAPLLLPFFRHSATGIQKLYLAGVLDYGHALVACFRALPGLRELVMQGSYAEGFLNNQFLDIMTPKSRKSLDEDADACLLPNLEVFQYEGLTFFSGRPLVDFLSKRWYGPGGALDNGRSPVARLRSATFKIMEDDLVFTEADNVLLAAMRQEGMHFAINDAMSRHNPLWPPNPRRHKPIIYSKESQRAHAEMMKPMYEY